MNRLFPARLGLRLLRGQGRSGLVRISLMALGTGLGVVVLLVALSVPHVITSRQARLAARTPMCASHLESCWVGVAQGDAWYGTRFVRLLVNRPPGTPAPAGLSRLPRPGEIAMSPALQRLADRKGNDLLRERLAGRRIGVIGPTGLLQPDELMAYVGVTAAQLPQNPALPAITGYGRGEVAFDAAGNVITTDGSTSESGPASTTYTTTDASGHTTTHASPFTDPRVGEREQREAVTAVAAVLLLVPVLLFLSACSRLSARTRDRRLAALRLLGMTPLETRAANAVETAAVASAGALIGLVVFELARAPLSVLHLGQYGWYASDLTPPVIQIVLVVVGLPLLAVLTATVAVRRTTGPVLNTRTAATARRLTAWRLAPLGTGAAVLGYLRSGGTATDWHAPAILGLGLLLVLVGLAVATPLLAQLSATGLARVTGSVSAQLAARGIQTEAAAVTRVGAGLVLLVFIASLAQLTLVAVYDRAGETAAFTDVVPVVRPALAEVPARREDGSAIPSTAWSSTPGVRAVVTVHSLSPATGYPGPHPWVTAAAVVSCADLRLIAVADLADCHEGVPYTLSTTATPSKPHGLVVADTETMRADTDLEHDVALRPIPSVLITTPAHILVTNEAPQLRMLLGTSIILPPGDPELDGLALTTPDAYYVVTDGTARTREALRTTGTRLDPTAYIRDFSPPHLVPDPKRALYTGLIVWGTVVVLLVAFASVTVGAVDRAVGRRRQVAMQVAIGVPPAIIRRAQAMTAVLPYAIGVVCATALSLLAAAGFDHITDIRGVPVSRAALLSTGIVALGGALVVGLSVLPSIGRPLTPDLLRQE